jgi:hypothetical protein
VGLIRPRLKCYKPDHMMPKVCFLTGATLLLLFFVPTAQASECAAVVRESLTGAIAPDLRAKVFDIAGKMLDQTQSNNPINGALVLETLGSPRKALDAKLREIVQLEIEDLLTDVVGISEDELGNLGPLIAFLKNPGAMPDTGRPPISSLEQSFVDKWGLAKLGNQSNPLKLVLAISRNPSPAVRPELRAQLVMRAGLALERSLYINDEDAALTFMAVLLRFGTLEQIVPAARRAGYFPAIVQLVRYYFESLFSSPARMDIRELAVALEALEECEDPSVRQISREMLFDFARTVSFPQFAHARFFEDPESEKRNFNLFRVNMLVSALRALELSGTRQEFIHHWLGSVQHRHRLESPAEIQLGNELLRQVRGILPLGAPFDLVLIRYASDLVLAMGAPVAAVDLIQQQSQAVVAANGLGEGQLLLANARLAYAMNDAETARRHLDYFSLTSLVTDLEGTTFEGWVAIVAEAKDGALMSRTEEEIAVIYKSLPSGSTKLREIVLTRWGTVQALVKDPRSETLLRRMAPELFAPAFAHSWVARGNQIRLDNEIMSSIYRNVFANQQLNRVGLEALAAGEVGDAISIFVRTRYRKGIVAAADRLAASGQPSAMHAAISYYAYASLIPLIENN